MDKKNLKVIIIKPAQSGKTRLIFNLIKDDIDIEPEKIHICVCDNFILQCAQTCSRQKDSKGIFAEDISENKYFCIDVHSKSKIAKHMNQISDLIHSKGTRIINTLGNSQKFREIYNYIEKEYNDVKKKNELKWKQVLKAEENQDNALRIYRNYLEKKPHDYIIYIDESDKVEKGRNSPIIDDIENLPNVDIYRISATHENTIKKHESVRIHDIKGDIYPECYVPIENMNFTTDKCEKGDEGLKKFITNGLNHYNKNYWFPYHKPYVYINPGVKTKYHKMARELVIKLCKFYVIVVNSNGITLYSPKNKQIGIIESKSKELYELIIQIFENIDIDNIKGLCIVGGMCLDRSVSLANINFPFVPSHAIISCNSSDGYKSYQRLRVYGNYSHHPSYVKPPSIYCTPKFRKLCKEQEYIAINANDYDTLDQNKIDKLKRESNINYNKELGIAQLVNMKMKRFTTIDKWKIFKKNYNIEGPNLKNGLPNEKGFIERATTGARKILIEKDVKAMKNSKNPASCLGRPILKENKNGDKIGRGYIYYKNQNDPASIRYAIVYGTLQLNI